MVELRACEAKCAKRCLMAIKLKSASAETPSGTFASYEWFAKFANEKEKKALNAAGSSGMFGIHTTGAQRQYFLAKPEDIEYIRQI
jgi:hypothetical protein